MEEESQQSIRYKNRKRKNKQKKDKNNQEQININQQPNNNGKVKLTKRKLVFMLGGWKKFRDYLQNFKKLYIPPTTDFNAEFGLQILKKRKKVFQKTEVNYVEGVPCETEFKVERLLKMIKTDKEVKEYLPDWSEKHVPDKTFLCNIINTVHDNSIIQWIKRIKERKLDLQQEKKNDYIEIDQDTLNELKEFTSIYKADPDPKNRLAGLLVESRKKNKEKRKARFVLEYDDVKFSDLAQDE